MACTRAGGQVSLYELVLFLPRIYLLLFDLLICWNRRAEKKKHIKETSNVGLFWAEHLFPARRNSGDRIASCLVSLSVYAVGVADLPYIDDE